jgi:hypothetical protein
MSCITVVTLVILHGDLGRRVAVARGCSCCAALCSLDGMTCCHRGGWVKLPQQLGAADRHSHAGEWHGLCLQLGACCTDEAACSVPPVHTCTLERASTQYGCHAAAFSAAAVRGWLRCGLLHHHKSLLALPAELSGGLHGWRWA